MAMMRRRARRSLLAPGRPTIDRNVLLMPAQQVDHFGNVLSPEDEAEQDDTPYQRR